MSAASYVVKVKVGEDFHRRRPEGELTYAALGAICAPFCGGAAYVARYADSAGDPCVLDEESFSDWLATGVDEQGLTKLTLELFVESRAPGRAPGPGCQASPQAPAHPAFGPPPSLPPPPVALVLAQEDVHGAPRHLLYRWCWRMRMYHCRLCQHWVTEEHLTSRVHLRRLAEWPWWLEEMDRRESAPRPWFHQPPYQ